MNVFQELVYSTEGYVSIQLVANYRLKLFNLLEKILVGEQLEKIPQLPEDEYILLLLLLILVPPSGCNDAHDGVICLDTFL